MKIEYKEIEPLEKRPAIHKAHIFDNTFEKDDQRKMILVQGEKNRFPAMTTTGEITILRPYENEIIDDLSKIIPQVKKNYAKVNLRGFPLDYINEFFSIAREEFHFLTNWYQIPLSTEKYVKKLKKFKNKGLEFKALSEEHIPQLKGLISNWSGLKKKSAFERFSLNEVKSPQDITNAMAKLHYLQSEVEWMDFKEQDDIYYKKKMEQPITTFYGAFKDNKLVAYSEVQANSNFASFDSRASVRQNSFSPQEFVDYKIMEKISKDGVKIVDRGPLNTRKGASGLINYKKKFGELIIHRESHLNGVEVYKNEIYDIAKEMQGNPFK